MFSYVNDVLMNIIKNMFGIIIEHNCIANEL